MNAPIYVCPMHPQVRSPEAAKCPRCDMDLMQEGARFAFVRHMLSRPLHLAVMAAVMLALMAAAMMMQR